MAAWVAAGRPASGFENTIANSGLNTKSDQELAEFSDHLNATADQDQKMVAQINAAYASHTLTIEKATDVQGLDYQETVVGFATKTSSTGSDSVSYNNDFLNQDANGKQHTLTQVGDVALYLTW